MVNHPTHYTRGDIEVWDFIRDQGLNYFRGNAIKYICRAGYKSPATEIEDIKKAIYYLENELQHAQQVDEPKRPSRPIPLGVWSRVVADTSGDSEEFDR